MCVFLILVRVLFGLRNGFIVCLIFRGLSIVLFCMMYLLMFMLGVGVVFCVSSGIDNGSVVSVSVNGCRCSGR